MTSLDQWGWCAYFDSQVTADERATLAHARVVTEQKSLYGIQTATGQLWADLTGRMFYEAESRTGLPAVGDWVLCAPRPADGRATIVRVLERRTMFSRKEAGTSGKQQTIAANIDVAFVVASLNQEFNPRRIERYLTMVHESGARPVVVLTKSDLCKNVDECIAEIQAICPGVDVHAISSKAGLGVEALEVHLAVGVTAVLLGSSGVGKSTLVNFLAGSMEQAVKEVRDDDAKGRHTTTARRLVHLPKSGAMIIDTPGMRELAVWEGEQGLSTAFGDIELLMATCRFGDCKHDTEPGCAIKGAVESGVLELGRLESYRKLAREVEFQARKNDKVAQSEQKKKWAKVHMEHRKKNRTPRE